MVSAGHRIRIYLVILVSVIVIGIAGLIVLEGLSPPDALYFLIVTIATVGYGDIVPRTLAGRMLVIVLIIAGVGSFVAVAANAIEVMLDRREEEERKKKQNMLIGVFFMEAGSGLLGTIAAWDPSFGEIRDRLTLSAEWTDQVFQETAKACSGHHFTIDKEQLDRAELSRLLVNNREILLQLLQNPALSEHDEFSNLLLAVFHLTEELSYRREYADLPEKDTVHLKGDTERVYKLLFFQWLGYMRHLKANYPYLFSLEMRTNPFDRYANPVIT